MRVRLYEVGERCGHVHWLDDLPVAISTTIQGEFCTGKAEQSEAKCVIAEDRGNLVIETCSDTDEVFLNDMPIEQGGLMPGDSLRVGSHCFVVSYERVTTEPSPPCRFRLPDLTVARS
ncbi:MAG: hypothetical protein KDA86_15565 [Planctomycetaceae bacterium]|nr:hypothetical protein [Planctomycetaceae bacterium]